MATNQITVDLTGTFNTALSGDFRFMAVLVEDSVTGTATSYNQANSYGGGANGPMGGFENLAATVAAALMRYDFVARALMGGFDDQSGSIPGSVTAGTPNTYQFTAPVPTTWNKSNLSVAAVVTTGTGAGRTVLNAAKLPVTLISGINDNSNSLDGSYLYPTTTSDAVNLVLQTGKSEQINVTVTDMLGKVVLGQDLGSIQPGTQKLTWNVSLLKSIINAPEVAILGVCRSTTEPVWNGSAFVPRLMLPLSLSWDHRAIDGAAAARFNVYLAQILGDFRRVLL